MADRIIVGPEEIYVERRGVRSETRTLTAQDGPAAGFEFRKIDGFDHVVVRAEIENADPVGHFGARGQHDHGRRLGGVAAPFQEAAAIPIGQHDINKDNVKGTVGDIGEMRCHLVQRPDPGEFGIPEDLEDSLDNQAVALVIFQQEGTFGPGCRTPFRRSMSCDWMRTAV